MPTLPSEPHQHRRVAESFGADPERYDRARPRYPAVMIDRIVAALPGSQPPTDPAPRNENQPAPRNANQSTPRDENEPQPRGESEPQPRGESEPQSRNGHQPAPRRP